MTLRMDDSHSLSQVVKHLDYPIPTLHILRIITDGPDYTHWNFLQFSRTPPFTLGGAGDRGNLSVGWTPNLPHVTEATIHTSAYTSRPMDSLLSTLERSPVLERVYQICTLTRFLAWSHFLTCRDEPIRIQQGRNVCTISTYPRFHTSPQPQIAFLRVIPKLVTYHRIFPVIPFSKRLPRLAELPELGV